MKTGTVKFYDKTKGWGFITIDNEQSEIFFHVTKVIGQLPNEKDKVQFDVVTTKKGLAAENVKIVK